MNQQPFNPPSARRLGAAAIAAALALFAGGAFAQTSQSGVVVDSAKNPVRSATAIGPRPGYVTSPDGRVVLSGSGQCVRSGTWVPANAAEPCDLVARADVPPPVAVVQPEPKPEPAPAPAAAAPEPPRPVIQKLTLSTDVLFDFNKAELKDAGKQRLDQLAEEIKDAQVDEIVATGHADRIASEGYNQKLSEQRAQAVRDYLASKVQDPNRVTAEGRGEAEPVTGDDCKKLGPERATNKKLVTCLQPDRRVEIEVLGSREVAATPGSPATGSTAGSGASATQR